MHTRQVALALSREATGSDLHFEGAPLAPELGVAWGWGVGGPWEAVAARQVGEATGLADRTACRNGLGHLVQGHSLCSLRALGSQCRLQAGRDRIRLGFRKLVCSCRAEAAETADAAGAVRPGQEKRGGRAGGSPSRGSVSCRQGPFPPRLASGPLPREPAASPPSPPPPPFGFLHALVGGWGGAPLPLGDHIPKQSSQRHWASFPSSPAWPGPAGGKRR